MRNINFDYLIEKITKTDFCDHPFKHIYIENFFSEEDFHKIISTPEIKLDACSNDQELFERLFEQNYKVINFPGCKTDYKKYIKLHASGHSLKSHTACESSGIALRLYPQNPLLIKLNDFLASESFNKAIADKFNISFESCNVDGGIQKYLDGYEISPHPDIRLKAATFMVNINTHPESEKSNHHTHYLRFKEEFAYIEEFWKTNPSAERAWVPWDWCTTELVQTKNNSIFLFSPANDTMHAVKARYDHLQNQRTQLYGNLWYEDSKTEYSATWEQLKVKDFSKPKLSALNSIMKSKVKPSIKKILLKTNLLKIDPNISDRGY